MPAIIDDEIPEANVIPDAETADLDTAETQEITFAQLGVPGPLVHVLAGEEKKTAFPIQQDTLPDSLAGRDVLGRGRTGSGKTLAFAIPLVARLGEVEYDEDNENKQESMTDFRRGVKKMQKAHARERAQHGFLPHPRALVLAPTRELANQIAEVISPLADIYGMSVATVYGGVRYQKQIHELRDGADIVVACPGRLEDLLQQGVLTLQDVKVAVLDEADEMADMGFLPPIKRLLGQIDRNAQHMLFSATLDHGVDEVVDEFLRDPKVHSVDDVTSPVDLMTHHLFMVNKNDKPELVRALASGKGRRILFTRTKFQAKKLAKSLTQHGIPAAELHGNLSQNQRDRNLQAFEDGEVNVMVATDVAARGIDISNVGLVIQVDPPDDPKSFLHRSGRTARAGQAGDVVTIITPDQKRYVRGLLKRAGLKLTPLEVSVDSPQVAEMIGEVAEPVEGWVLPDLKKKGRGARGGRGDFEDGGSRSRKSRRRNRGERREREARFSRNPKDRRRQQDKRRKDGEARTTGKPQQRTARLTEEQRDFASAFLGDIDHTSGSNPRYDQNGEYIGGRKGDTAKSEKFDKRKKGHKDQNGHKDEERKAKKAKNFENGAKRIKKKLAEREDAWPRDERDESVKRHERRMKARYGEKKDGKPKKHHGDHKHKDRVGKPKNSNGKPSKSKKKGGKPKKKH